jgi:DNA-binding HxlR family transcriptional regulator
MKRLQNELTMLKDKRGELRRLMDEIDSQEMGIKQLAAGAVQQIAGDQLESEILVALLSGVSRPSDLAEKLGVPEAVALDRLKRLQERGMVQLSGEDWCI